MWYGPYVIDEELGKFTYALRTLAGNRSKYPVSVARIKPFVHRQLRPTATAKNSGIEVSCETHKVPYDVNNGEDDEENIDQMSDNESIHTETQNANETQSMNEGDENTEESSENQIDSDDLPDQYYEIEKSLRHKGGPGNRSMAVRLSFTWHSMSTIASLKNIRLVIPWL